MFHNVFIKITNSSRAIKLILIQTLEMKTYSLNLRLDNLLQIAINGC